MSFDKIIYRLTDKRIPAATGIGLVGDILDNAGFQEQFRRVRSEDKRSRKQIDCGAILTTFIGLLCMGKPDFEAISEFQNDAAYYQTALHLKRGFPSTATLRQRMDEIGKTQREQLLDFNAHLLKSNHVEPTALKNGMLPMRKAVEKSTDRGKVDSHPAIIPTMNVPKSLSEIPSDDERQLYDLLVKSLIRIVYPKAEIEDTTVLLNVNGNTFKATGSVITNNGWYAVDALPEKTGLPPVSEGESYSGRYELKQGFTEPPKPYTEADLITAMETAGKHLEDEEARALMKAENKGLGTPATRARIINALFDNGYLTKNKKSVIPTEKGKFLIKHLPVEELKSPEMTGQWEKRLHDIADEKEDYQAFVSAMEQKVRDWYSAVVLSADTEKYVSDEDTLSCPFCGAKIIKGKFGYFCSAKKDTGCSFSVGNEICGKAISDAQAIRLIGKGKTTLIKGFKKKDGSGEFDAYLVVDKTAKKIKFEFPAKTIILLDILS